MLAGARRLHQRTTKLTDTHYALIKEYAQSYDTLTDAHADDLAKRMAALEVQPQHCGSNGFRDSVRWSQESRLRSPLDRRVNLLIDLQLAAMIPVVK